MISIVNIVQNDNVMTFAFSRNFLKKKGAKKVKMTRLFYFPII
jgi:hypothetical protein